MPTTNKDKPDSRLLLRVVSGIGGVFAAVIVFFFIRSAPNRSPDACIAPDGKALTSPQCLSCHRNPHQDGKGYQMRRVDTQAGTISTVSADTPLRNPQSVVADAEGNRYWADPLAHLVWKFPATGKSESDYILVAGGPMLGPATPGFDGDGGLAVEARLNHPSSVAPDEEGSLYIADTLNNRVRRVNKRGIIETVAGNGERGFDGDGKRVTDAAIEKPISLAFDKEGNLLIAHGNGRQGRIRRVDARRGTIETLVGGAKAREKKGDGHPAREAVLKRPVELTLDPETGDLYIAESRPVLRHWNIGNCGVCHRLP